MKTHVVSPLLINPDAVVDMHVCQSQRTGHNTIIMYIPTGSMLHLHITVGIGSMCAPAGS